MTLYYQGDWARITHEVFETQRPIEGVFAINELRCIHVVQDVLSSVGGRTIRWGSSAVAGVGAVMTVIGWPVYHLSLLPMIALAVMTTASAVTAVCVKVDGGLHELRAVYRQRLVCLYADRDKLRFAQVVRALRRVLEHRADHA